MTDLAQQITEIDVHEDNKSLRRAKWGGLIGSSLEQYDFVAYGTASALVFNKVFFPSVSPAIGIIASFGAYAVGFCARPLGGLFFSLYGDRLGRKWVLVTTVFLMGIATFLIGCLPTYEQAGLAAPILLVLLRCMQGFGAGAEFTGGTTFLTEFAPPGKRGITAALTWVGASGGTALGALAWVVVQQTLPDDLLTYGWRLVFLSSAFVTLAAYVMRLKLRESHVFLKKAEEDKAKAAREAKAGRRQISPIVDVWRHGRKNVIRVFALVIGVFVQSYAYQVFMGSYLVTYVGADTRTIFTRALFIGAIAGMGGAVLGGWLSDRLGRRLSCLLYEGFLIVFAVPAFMMLDSGNPYLITLVIVIGFLTAAEGIVSAQSAFLPELFGVRYRYAGITLGREAASVFGGAGPLLCSVLITWAGGNWVPVVIFMMLIMAVSFVATLLCPETRDRDLSTESDAV